MNIFNENRQICFSTPRRLTEDTSWHIHIPLAFYLVQQLRPKVIVELGVGAGDSYGAWCQAVTELEIFATCYGFNITSNCKHGRNINESKFEELVSYHDQLYGKFSKLNHTTAHGALSYFDDGAIDLLHINGLNVDEFLNCDFDLWLRKMSKNGIILIHGINVKNQNICFSKFSAHLRKNFPYIEFPHGFGLGIAAINQFAPAAIKCFFNKNGVEIGNIIRFFYLLGRSVLLYSNEKKWPLSGGHE
ncbi:class I SAM-dependent methyltransferase [Candidatus Uhrbacteria bacterium]|nr:class I SAM-dependent methyltransferase [Candidatus Uhrbacteria bacterium]